MHEPHAHVVVPGLPGGREGEGALTLATKPADARAPGCRYGGHVALVIGLALLTLLPALMLLEHVR